MKLARISDEVDPVRFQNLERSQTYLQRTKVHLCKKSNRDPGASKPKGIFGKKIRTERHDTSSNVTSLNAPHPNPRVIVGALQVRRAGKTWRLNFPTRFDGPFVGAAESIGLIQRVPRFCLGVGGWEEGLAGGEKVDEGGGRKGGRVLEGWTGLASLASASADVEFTLLPRSISLPSPTRASGQFEITLSPSQCVQSKLQFKSSLLPEGKRSGQAFDPRPIGWN